MSTLEKIQQLEQKIVDNNFQLMNQVRQLRPEDQKVYSEKVAKLVTDTKDLIKKWSATSTSK